MLSRKAVHDRMREARGGSPEKPQETSKEAPMEAEEKSTEEKTATSTCAIEPTKTSEVLKRMAPLKSIIPSPPAKKAKAQNFLLAGAKKAKAARSARTAARVGFERTSKTSKLSNTGSGVPISQVVRLKYVKGFTQAVRTPCRLDDLA